MVKNEKATPILGLLIILEIAVLIILFFFFSSSAFAVVGAPNATVTTLLDVGNVFPEILNVTIQAGAAGFDLTANSTTPLTVLIIARDFNGQADIINFTTYFFDQAVSSIGAANDNNSHYTNVSCLVDVNYGDIYEVNATCGFAVWYYANNATWNASVYANDTLNYQAFGSDTITINTLLAVGLPSTIDYGTVNATFVSDERTANVTNFGNVRLNLSLSGYGYAVGDGNAMNCTLGAIKNISVYYEKYNLTTSNTSIGSTMTLAQFQNQYVNLTSAVVTKYFGLNYRQNDGSNEAFNATYWRIYVPTGVAGSCRGNIIFGATQDTGV